MADPAANRAGDEPATTMSPTAAEAENLRLYREFHPTYKGRHLIAEVLQDSSTPASSSSGSTTPDQSDRDASPATTESSDTSVEVHNNFARKDLNEIITTLAAAKNNVARETVVTTAKAIAKKSKRKPRFKDVKFKPNTTILEAEASRTSVFAGFYTVFWLGTFILFAKTILVNYRNTGYYLDTHIVSILWRDLPKIAITDLVLFLLTFANVVLQQAIVKEKVSWNSTGWAIQSCYEIAFIGLALWWPIYNDYPWIGRVFLCLHSLVLLMKQHSYAFFCGYLSGVNRDLHMFESALSGLRTEDGNNRKPTQFQTDQEECLLDEIEICHTELKSPVPMSKVRYPNNVTFFNFFDYMMLPTLVYELEYPRTKHIRWSYVFEKTAAIFGVFFLMIIIAEQYFYPIVMHALSLRSLPFLEKVKEYPFLFFDLLFPFLLMYLLTWYIIWDAILNEIAELTCFADRYFYGAWWNSVQWDQFAREWNIPVHQFLLRHVYHSTISAFQVSKGAATVITFLLSSVIHELVMFVIFKRLRGYLLILQMCQLPLVQLSKTKILRNNMILGNVIFWIGIYTGPSMMCMLYLTF
ncbi:MBOAT, membrane-bound O-acyltransferase family-domain-containing protein [Lipomyces kononenkoae]|uniref:MBOAT, membrane-bound O-acyltransferase family-domain-containing protein n=1 Tax=Lipomyces kononenkoae TaxID=34357 RepID=A0ACC3T935_LIPKO